MSRNDRAAPVRADRPACADFIGAADFVAHPDAIDAAAIVQEVFGATMHDGNAGIDRRAQQNGVEGFAFARKCAARERQFNGRCARRNQPHAMQCERLRAHLTENADPVERCNGAGIEIFAADFAAWKGCPLDERYGKPGSRQE